MCPTLWVHFTIPLEPLRKRLWSMQSATLDKQIKQDMKDFLRALCKDEYHNIQMYEALLNVDEGYTFLTWFAHNLESMWS